MPVEIHGKQYKTVVERVNELCEKEAGKYSLTTEIVHFNLPIIVMQATLKIGENLFTGHAMEDETKGSINKTSAVENCETSAIGRALASAGYGGEQFASANEVEQAIHQQNTKPALKTPAQGARVLTTQEAEFVGMAKNHLGEKWPKIEAWTKNPHTQKAIEDTLDKLLKECPKGFAITDLLDLQEYCLQTMYTDADEPQNLTDAKLLEMSRREFKLDTAELSAPQINHLALLIESEPPF